MKTKWMLMMVIGIFTMGVLVQCTKSEKVVASQTESATTVKTVSISDFDVVLNNEFSDESIDDIMLCVYNCLTALPAEELTASEAEALAFVREEELMAHDVYQAMYALYPIPVFNNISNSESIHAYAAKVLLDKYNLPDPAENHVQGVFANAAIQELYNNLVATGSESSNNAMVVGATIEDFDIADLIGHMSADVDNQDIQYAFEQLHKGSRNHMRAFNAHLNFRNIVYTPQFISQEIFDGIVNSGWEIGNGFCVCSCNSAQAIENNDTK